MENSVVGYCCLGVHDLAIAKLVAKREKDKVFVKDLLVYEMLDIEKMKLFAKKIAEQNIVEGNATHVQKYFERRCLEAQEEISQRIRSEIRLKI